MNLLSFLPIVWLAVILAAIFCEAAVPRLTAIWFAPAALAALVCGFFHITPAAQSAVFVCTAVVLIVISRIVRSISRRI